MIMPNDMQRYWSVIIQHTKWLFSPYIIENKMYKVVKQVETQR